MTDIREQKMQNRIDSLTLEKENLRNENICLKEQIAQLKKLAFGSRTEKTKKIPGEVEEINLFDEAEVEAKGSAGKVHRLAVQCSACHRTEISVFHAALPAGTGMEIHWHSPFPCHTGQLGDPVSRRLAYAAGRLHARRAFESAGNPCRRNASPSTE